MTGPSDGGSTYLLDRAEIPGAERLSVAREHGAYRALEKALRGMKPADVTEAVKASGLRGRGGAGFPTGLKWTFMPPPADPRSRYFLLNADESEPGTFKDRVLLERDPHLVIEGLALASYAIGARTCYVYMRGEFRRPKRIFEAALGEAREAGLLGKDLLGSGFDLEVFVHRGAGAYIAGEETGAMESIEGKPARPRPKPPFPAGHGLWGCPTTINNVETVANVPAIVERGAEWYRRIGTDKSPGNFLCGVSGHVNRPGVYERPLGTSVRAILEGPAGGVQGRLKAFYPGGSSTGILPARHVDVAMDHESLRAVGSMLGTGGITVLNDTACVVRTAAVLARFYDHETCGQCSQCRVGCAWTRALLDRIEGGAGRLEDLDLLLDLGSGMSGGKTICAFADGAAIPLLSAVRLFSSEFEAHVREGRCPFPEEPEA
ncbi:MAG TPA: NADH-quinone oxidoreductase subunit NuoF [Planctomycetota bacterium]|nr:NADH-quinone oxidoreductase subunit NuoF [Planctomycetota bacterium]